jgi:aminoglycoside phosphotransferase (APT) family kinase protein
MGEEFQAAGIDPLALARWMDAEGLHGTGLENVELLAGGTQNLLLRFSRGGRDFVLRRPPLHMRANSNVTMQREARVLGALAGTDVPHPGLIAAADESVIGACFYLMEPIDGFNATSGLPELHRTAAAQHRMGLSMVEALAALHALDPFALGLEGFGRVEGFLERQVGRWGSQLASYADFAGWPGPGELGDVAAVGAWLEANRPASFVPGILHGDFHLANVMFRHDAPEIAAIIDWELATLGDPLIDLGWLLATWPDGPDCIFTTVKPWIGFPEPAELVAHYAARSARSLEAVGWYAVFACYKLGILLEGTHARACAGKAPQETGDKLHSRAVWLFDRARHWISTGVL